MTLPGRWLRAASARLCTKRTMDRVIDPLVADVQAEYEEAVRTNRRWRAAWIWARGCGAFWTAVGLHTLQSGPRSLWAGRAANGWTLGRTIGYSLLACVVITLLLAAAPMVDVGVRFGVKVTLLLLPQAIALSVPIALALGIVFSVPGGRVSASSMKAVLLLAGVAALLAFGAMVILPVTNQAYRVAVAEKLDVRGITKYSLPRGINELSLPELAGRIKQYEAGGSPQTARRFARAYHLRFALPAATFVLSLLALGICGTVRHRGGRIVATVVVIGLYWAGFAFMEVTTQMPPIVSVWGPNMVVTAVALALLEIQSRRLQQPPQAQV
jgi:hypothetical protein